VRERPPRAARPAASGALDPCPKQKSIQEIKMATNTAQTSSLQANPARIVNIIVGVWLFISAFIWPHTYAQMTNTWIVGALCAVFAAIALRAPQVRYANAVLAVWLFISVWALPTMNVGTSWNNVIVAIVMFIAALTPAEMTRGVGRPVRV
jgi:hypothetical protein